jgi:hypothetical protein
MEDENAAEKKNNLEDITISISFQRNAKTSRYSKIRQRKISYQGFFLKISRRSAHLQS